MYSKELIKGTLRTVVLRLLDREGRMYGYQMSKLVEDMSAGQYKLTEGALYPLLHKLVKDGMLVTETETVNGRARRYYRITEAGRAAAADRREEFRRFLLTMRQLLDLQPE
ncbi:PadR family transcriptional regulator [Lewinella sp. W8]|uniref:PadR family transcriptional regulator n=1 Tax=Lewinella sp. W8 TaxID=2528208 RepID=UPI001067787D|nr:PadR family transcriptional regulator [Lewinella sp. W8]MTB50554.1 PadR family transcriptional regulator [Lewinella sp. W8]